MSNVPRQRKDERVPAEATDPELGAANGVGGGGNCGAVGTTAASSSAATASGKPQRRTTWRQLRARPVTTAVVACAVVCAVVGFIAIERALAALLWPAGNPGRAAVEPPPADARLVDGAGAENGMRDPAGVKWEEAHDAQVAAVLAHAAVEAAADLPGNEAAHPGNAMQQSDDVAGAGGAGNGAPPDTGINAGAAGAVNGGGELGAGQPGAPEAPRCVKKFEPGKLGSEKVLCVTDEYYFDIAISDVEVGRLVIGVFGAVVPNSAANFRALTTCTGAFADPKLCFKGDTFHRVVKDFVIQGGSKATGRSIFGGTFREEAAPEHHSFLSHSDVGVVSWAEYPIGSQFFITTTTRNLSYLDKNHVVFGIVTDGLSVLEQITGLPTGGDANEIPGKRVSIVDCGNLHAPPAVQA
jgi:cyclophilin family peptidyl-prolyl cis-trans isomerase